MRNISDEEYPLYSQEVHDCKYVHTEQHSKVIIGVSTVAKVNVSFEVFTVLFSKEKFGPGKCLNKTHVTLVQNSKNTRIFPTKIS